MSPWCRPVDRRVPPGEPLDTPWARFDSPLRHSCPSGWKALISEPYPPHGVGMARRGSEGVKGVPQVRRCACGESACKRDSVARRRVTIHLMRPTRAEPTNRWTGRPSALLGLAPSGVTEPYESPRTLVRSYRTVAPLPVTGEPVHRRFLSVAHPSGRPDLARASTLLCGVPTFLDTVEPCRGHPADSPRRRV